MNGLTQSKVNSITVAPDSSVIYITTYNPGNVYKSTNGGTTFSTIKPLGEFSYNDVAVDPNNYEELANEIERILSDKALQSELISKGLKHAALHTWESAAARLLRIFNDIRERGPWQS